MSYRYEQERPELFTERGIDLVIQMSKRIAWLLKEAGAFTAEAAYRGCSGSNWTMLAVLDYLAEKGELVCLSPPETWGQYKVYTSASDHPRVQVTVVAVGEEIT